MPARRARRKPRPPGRPKLLQDRVRILLDLEREDVDALTDLAAEMVTSRSDLIRRAVRKLLKEKR